MTSSCIAYSTAMTNVSNLRPIKGNSIHGRYNEDMVNNDREKNKVALCSVCVRWSWYTRCRANYFLKNMWFNNRQVYIVEISTNTCLLKESSYSWGKAVYKLISENSLFGKKYHIACMSVWYITFLQIMLKFHQYNIYKWLLLLYIQGIQYECIWYFKNLIHTISI